MRQGPLLLLFAALLTAPSLPAEEEPAEPLSRQPLAAETSPEAHVDELEQRLAESERQRTELATQLQADSQRETAQLKRLREENQQLKRLLEVQSLQPERLVSEQQMWFLIGAGVAFAGLIFGALLRGRRRTQREWI
jgi:TolA-binding protein